MLRRFFGASQQQQKPTPEVDAILLDGAAVVQMLNPGTAITFQDYADSVFKRYVSWDVYLPGSLTATTRKKRGKGVRRRVSPSNTMPKNWKGFLRDGNNKTELFAFLAQQVIGITVEESKVVYATSKQNVLGSSCETDLSNVSPYTQEETDARLILHAADAEMQGKSKISIRTVDTDVVVLAVSFFSRMNLEELLSALERTFASWLFTK